MPVNCPDPEYPEYINFEKEEVYMDQTEIDELMHKVRELAVTLIDYNRNLGEVGPPIVEKEASQAFFQDDDEDFDVTIAINIKTNPTEDDLRDQFEKNVDLSSQIDHWRVRLVSLNPYVRKAFQIFASEKNYHHWTEITEEIKSMIISTYQQDKDKQEDSLRRFEKKMNPLTSRLGY